MANTAYTLTGATDWPMLVATLKFLGGVVYGLLALIAALIAAMWFDFRKSFKEHQDGEAERCAQCVAKRDDEFEAIWETFDICCPRHGNRPTVRDKGGG